MLKVYLEPAPDRAIERINRALTRYAPECVSFADKKDCDLYILHVVGRRDAIKRKTEEIVEERKKYAIIQYCVRSTQKPETYNWWTIWKLSELVWSYYDLPRWCKEESELDIPFNFPCGVISLAFNVNAVPELTLFAALSCVPSCVGLINPVSNIVMFAISNLLMLCFHFLHL